MFSSMILNHRIIAIKSISFVLKKSDSFDVDVNETHLLLFRISFVLKNSNSFDIDVTETHLIFFRQYW